MLIRVLGPLEVSAGTSWQRVAASKPRSLLALLVTAGGQPVSIDHLVEELWNGTAPGSAVNLVHQYVRQVRRVLDDPAGELLRTRAPGYQLVLDNNELDVPLFEQHAREGRDALADGRYQEAADHFGQARELWRGTPYADVPRSGSVATEANRIEQLWLDTTEARIDADLALDRHFALVPALQALTGEHPLRERFWGQLMTALSRSGRPAEALEAYQQLYRVLVDELGVEPGRPVRDLQQRILRGDPELDPAAIVVAPRAAGGRADPAGTRADAVPRQLPAGIADFVGRAEHLTRLDALLPGHTDRGANAVVISVIAGTAGVGKTALAVHWAHRVADRFPDGQLYLNLRGYDPVGQPITTADALRGLLDAMQVPPERVPTGVDAQAALYRSLLANRRMLVVLDNARDAEQVRPLLPGAPGCHVVVTSRDQLSSLVVMEGAHVLTLDLLTTDEARRFLAHRLGQDRTDAEPAATDEIVERCASLPLPLAIVAARAATHPTFPLRTLARELRDTRGGLEVFARADAALDLRATFSWSYSLLSPPTARLFALLSVHPGTDITAPAAASLAGVPTGDVTIMLSELCRAHLMVEHAPGRYTFHDLLRAYSAELADAAVGGTERRAALHRILDHYLHTAHAAAMLLYPRRDPITLTEPRPDVIVTRLTDHGQALAWLTGEDATLRAAVEHAASDGFDRHVCQLAWALSEYLRRRQHSHDKLAVHHAALDASRRLADRAEQARAHRELARAYGWLGRVADAYDHLEQARRLCDELGDRVGEAHAHLQLSIMLEKEGKHADALVHDEQALELYRSTDHRAGQARALNAIGWDHTQLGDYHRALTCCRQALAMCQELGNRPGEAATWDSLGYAHHHLGDHRRAIDCYQRAIGLYRELGNATGEADTLTRLGDTQLASGDDIAARRVWSRALSILDEHGQPAEPIRLRLHQLDRKVSR